MESENVRHDWSKEDYGEYRRKIVRESQKKRRKKAMEKGLCPICCIRTPIEGRSTCEICLNRVKTWQNKNRR